MSLKSPLTFPLHLHLCLQLFFPNYIFLRTSLTLGQNPFRLVLPRVLEVTVKQRGKTKRLSWTKERKRNTKDYLGVKQSPHPPFLPQVYARVLSHFNRVQLFATLLTVDCARLLCPWDSPAKNTGVGSHALLQRIFPTQGSHLRLFYLPHW